MFDDYYLYANTHVPIQKSYIDFLLRPYWRSLANQPDYESGLCKLLTKIDLSGDICIVGGGLGVVATKIGMMKSDGGSIICYEGSEKYYLECLQTYELNKQKIKTEITFINSVVATNVGVYGDAIMHTTPVSELGHFDILVMDCEGAEKQIIRELQARPKVILVETHGVYGASTSEVKKLLGQLNYEVKRSELAEDGLAEFCVNKDIYVLLAQLIEEV